MNEPLRNEIVERWRGGQSQRSIARDLRASRWTVARVIVEHQTQRGETPPPAARAKRTGLLAEYEAKLGDLLARYPDISITRLLEELRRDGYRGGYTVLRQRVQQLRPQRRRGFVERFETAPGVQAQMDYAVYEIDFTHEGPRRVNLFSYVLGYRQSDWLQALEHASRFGAYSFSSLERILAVQAQPKSCAEHLADQNNKHLAPRLLSDPIPPRPPAAYQQLWNEGTCDEPTTSPPEVEHAEESAAEPPAGDSGARPPAGDTPAGPAVAP